MVGYYADMPASQYKSEGYRLEEMVRVSRLKAFLHSIRDIDGAMFKGPANAEKLHHAEIMRNAADMQGCPVASMFASGL